ncbi:hypothetical protein TWF696_007310 [Orbilia brochopaga]|uniref:Uncharacterized protein n=1 Tax=Orbilia brochopaga TaxID=3140254 RepID=A0AAV9UVS3_9PEZI
MSTATSTPRGSETSLSSVASSALSSRRSSEDDASSPALSQAEPEPEDSDSPPEAELEPEPENLDPPPQPQLMPVDLGPPPPPYGAWLDEPGHPDVELDVELDVLPMASAADNANADAQDPPVAPAPAPVPLPVIAIPIRDHPDAIDLRRNRDREVRLWFFVAALGLATAACFSIAIAWDDAKGAGDHGQVRYQILACATIATFFVAFWLAIACLVFSAGLMFNRDVVRREYEAQGRRLVADPWYGSRSVYHRVCQHWATYLMYVVVGLCWIVPSAPLLVDAAGWQPGRGKTP